jgi:hypothetical protein
VSEARGSDDAILLASTRRTNPPMDFVTTLEFCRYQFVGLKGVSPLGSAALRLLFTFFEQPRPNREGVREASDRH